MSADQLHGERLLCSQYVQEGAPVASPAEQVAEQTVRMGGISIKDLAAVLNPSTTKSLDLGQHSWSCDLLVAWHAAVSHIVTCYHVCNISLECMRCACVHCACTA